MNKNKEWSKEYDEEAQSIGLDLDQYSRMGMFIHSKITQAEDNMRKRCVEALPKKVNKIEHWGHEIDCYYCIDCQEGVDTHPAHFEGFNEAIDQVTQNINNLDKEDERHTK